MIFLVEFIFWHYSAGLTLYLHRWLFLMRWTVHYFSLPLLLPTLFSPWKRLVDDQPHVGFRPDIFFRQLTFNLISRSIGAVVRTFLLIIGTLTLFPAFFAGLAGFICWLVLPPVGLPYFLLRERHGRRFLTGLLERLQQAGRHPVGVLFANSAGKFVLAHTGLDLVQLIKNSSPGNLRLSDFNPESYSDFMALFTRDRVWDERLLQTKGANYQDLLVSAQWWDSVFSSPPSDTQMHFGRPGIGLELLYGYTPQLNQYSEDLAAPQAFTHHLIGRQDIVSRIERTLTSGKSVILTGLPGVGKTTIVLEFARRAAAGELGPHMVYKRVMELNYNFLLSENIDLNQKKTKFSELLLEAANAGNVILVIKDLYRITHSQLEGLDFTDILEKYMAAKNLKIIAVSSQMEYDRFIAPNARLSKFFEPIEAVAPGVDIAQKILFESASLWEKQKSLLISVQALRAILDGCDRYITDTPFPEKALELLDFVITFMETQSKSHMTADDVNVVLSEKTGISLARLSQKEKDLLSRLEDELHLRLVGQDAAVSLIAKSLRARTVGVKNEDRPIGSFLFLGPTGVGKTQTAKTLAVIYYGSQSHIIRFDMAEFTGPEGVSRLIGSVSQNQPGVLTTAIKNRPASLLLLDEIEKAPSEVFNLFLTLLDEGFITDAFGKKIICRHLFVIATSNAGAEYVRQLVMQGASGELLQKEVLDYVQKNRIFSPEFLNRFDGAVVFEPLTTPQLEAVAKLMLEDLRQIILKKNIDIEIAPEVYSKLAGEGYQPEFGARPMRRIVDITLGDIISREILAGTVKPGDKAVLFPGSGPGEYLLKPVI